MSLQFRYFGLIALPVVALCGAAQGATLTRQDLVTVLRGGGYVIVMRHASSPRAPPEAAQANPDNLQHERQLDEVGRASARAMGDALRTLKVPIGPVFSSPTYRALETIRLADFGTPKPLPELGDAGHSMQPDPSGQRGAWLRQRVTETPPAGTNAILVTHFPNVAEAFPADAKGLEDGEALIFHPDGHGGAMLAARVKIDEWPHWAAATH
jgi:phosphohistidine phosphatase SixA